MLHTLLLEDNGMKESKIICASSAPTRPDVLATKSTKFGIMGAHFALSFRSKDVIRATTDTVCDFDRSARSPGAAASRICAMRSKRMLRCCWASMAAKSAERTDTRLEPDE